MGYDAGDEKQVEAKQKELELERIQDLEDIKEILSKPSGVRFFRRLAVDGKVLATTFTGNSYSYFNEGGRNLALRYIGDVIEACPKKFIDIVMLKKEGEK